jgi:serine/threonine-protein kinase
MGEVYRARDTNLRRDVAIKVLPVAMAGNPARLQRFEREARALAALNHPNIATVYAIEERAIVMELVDGEDLSAIIARHAGSRLFLRPGPRQPVPRRGSAQGRGDSRGMVA